MSFQCYSEYIYMLWGCHRSCIISFSARLHSSPPLLFTPNFTLTSSCSSPWKWHSVQIGSFRFNHCLKKSKSKPALFEICILQTHKLYCTVYLKKEINCLSSSSFINNVKISGLIIVGKETKNFQENTQNWISATFSSFDVWKLKMN